MSERSPTLLHYDIGEVNARVRAHEAEEAAWRTRADTYWIETARTLMKADRDDEGPMLMPRKPIQPEKVVEYAKKLRALMEKP